jgi:hypothetical protein
VDYLAKILSYKDQSVNDSIIAAMRKAGLKWVKKPCNKSLLHLIMHISTNNHRPSESSQTIDL